MTAKGEGSAVIFAKHNSRYYRCSVTVSGNMLTPAVEGTSWHFIMQLKNSSSKDITLTKLEIIDYLNGETVGEPWSRSGNELASLHLGNVVLSKGETHTWDDWHPVVTRYDHRDYVFTFKNASDKTSKQTFSYQLAAQQSNLGGSTCDIGLTPSKDGGNWVFNIILENNTARSITLQKLTVLKKLEGKTLDTYSYSKAQCADMSLSTAALKAGAFTFWEDFHPVVNDFDEFEYTFTFKDSAGKTVKQVFSFNLSTQIINYSENQEKDLKTLRHDADFEVRIADGIYWVPANALGESRYTNAEIYDMLTLSPGKKQSKFSTLYEALQLYQVGNFYSSDDNIRVYENGINWEHHKPGYDAVRTNNGCCATSANWLNYILKNDYDEVGYIETSQADGSGHIYNYIKQDGWYYIIDMAHYRTDWVATSPRDR